MRILPFRPAMLCSLALGLAALTPAARAQSTGEIRPVAVITINSYEQLMQDVDYIGGLMQMPGVSGMVDGQIRAMTGGAGLAGFDKTKPIGVLVDMSMGFPNFAAYVPVTDQPGLLKTLAPLGIAATDMGDGVQQINAYGQDAYAKNADGWMVLGMSPEMINAMFVNPESAFGDLTSRYDVAIQVNVQNLPEALRQQALQAMSQASSSATKLANETDEQFAARQAVLQTQIDTTMRTMREMDNVVVGLAVAGAEKTVYLDVNMTAMPGTQTAEEMAQGRNLTTNFAGFAQPGSAVTASFAGVVSEANAAQIETAVAQMRTQMEEHINHDAPEAMKGPAREALTDIVDAVLATLKGGKMDGGALAVMAPGSTCIVVGGLIAEPAKIESALKKLAGAAAKPGETPEIYWNAATHGNVTFHTLQAPVPDADAQKLFGSTIDVVVGLGPDAAYLSFGHDAASVLKSVIDGSAAAPAKPIKPFEMTVTLSKVAEVLTAVADEDERPTLQMLSGLLSSVDGQDHVRVIAQPIENGMQMRFAVEQGVVQALGQAAMYQAMGGGAATGAPAGATP